MRARRLGPLLQSGLLLVVATAVALLLGEWVIRRAAPQPRPLTIALRGLHAPDAALGYTMVAGFSRRVRTPTFACDLRTNQLGLRDSEIGPHEPGRMRLLCLGDSFVLGIHAGVADSAFVERLGTVLDARLRAQQSSTGQAAAWRGAEAINAGVDGYGTTAEVGLLERLGPQLGPDAVLLAFYLGNDFTDNSGATRMTVVDGYQMLEASAPGYRTHFRPLHRQARLWLHTHSHLYAFLKERLVQPLRRALAPDPASDPAAPPRSFDTYRYDAGFDATLRSEPSPQLTAGMEATRTALHALRSWCDVRGVPALLVALPAEQQVSPTARAAWLARFGLDAATRDFTLPNRRLSALAAEAGLPCFDLTPGFAAHLARGDDDVHLHGDNHWTAAGHRLAALLLEAPVWDELVTRSHPVLGGR